MRIDRVMYMRKTITVTRKGQTTLPAALRRKFGIGKTGGVLAIDFHESKNIAILSRPMRLEELSARATSYVRPGSKPLKDVRAYLQKHRKVDRDGYTE